MKKILLFTALVIATLQLTAANVDLMTAQQSAQRFLMNKAAKGQIAASTPAIKWTQEVKNSTNATQTVYYIVNTDKGYVIVSGDDRGRQVLACGDMPLESMNDIPENMQFFLDMYKAELEYLQAHPGQVVKTRNTSRGETVAPMLTTLWQQGGTNGRSPYNRLCPQTGGQYCLVGCAAVSLSQVMNYWKYPAGSPALPAYVGPRGVAVPALPAYTFDWNNMLDKYVNSNWSEAQRDAIANLMRYVGQAEFMDYDPTMSGADEDQMLMAVRLFGYDAGVHYMLKNDYDLNMTELVNDEDWNATMQSELAAGRPLMYCAAAAMSDGSGFYGHAFNVDGYNADTDMYHVNFGQSEDKNGDYAFNAFGYGITVYKYFQLMFVGMQPPAQGVPVPPRIVVNPVYNYLETHAGWTTTADIHVIGLDLTDDITVTVTDENGYHTTDVSTISLSDLDEANHKILKVTYAPQEVGEHWAYVTLSSPGAEPVDIYFYDQADEAPLVKYNPVMLPADEEAITATSFRADWTDQTPAQLVESYTLEVNTKPDVNLVTEADWSGVGQDYNNISTNPGLVMPQDWVFTGSGLWQEGGYISINASSSIKSPVLDLTSANKVSVVLTGRGATGSANLVVSTSKGSQTVSLTSTMSQYVVVLDCAASDQVTFSGSYGYPGFKSIQIYAGEMMLPELRATETGDATTRTITGITDKFYTVNGLTPGGSFVYKVKTIYTDGTESAWSNVKQVTLLEGPAFTRGDVNGVGGVDMDDLTALINYLLDDTSVINQAGAASCNDADDLTIVDMDDLTALINYLLTETWAN